MPVAADQRYDNSRGFGFLAAVDGQPQAFSVRVAPGDYRVTVQLRSAGPRTVFPWLEDRRMLAAPVVLAAGAGHSHQFVVNVRDTRLDPVWADTAAEPRVAISADEARARDWDDQLTVGMAGITDTLASVKIEPIQARRILLAGDSTVASQASGDAASWGQMLGRFLDPNLAIANHARNGASIKSFITSFRWDKLMADTRAGDVVVLQFGHNDEKKEHARTYSAPDHAYPAYLRALVSDVRQRGAKPVLVTPVARRTFNAKGTIDNSHAGYDAAVRQVAAELAVPMVDLTLTGAQVYQTLGREHAPAAFAQDGRDPTHHNAYGAYVLGCLVARSLAAVPDLALRLADDAPACTPTAFPRREQFELAPVAWRSLSSMPGRP